MADPSVHTLTLPGPMLERGFWLYVWCVETPSGELLYVGRTGDNSSPHAAAPYTRMGQHLGNSQSQNALRAHLEKRGIDPISCINFQIVSYGPIFPEVEREGGTSRKELMELHIPLRNIVGALEKALADSLTDAGYDVLNAVKWKHPLDEERWKPVRTAFSEHFPKLKSASKSGDRG